MPEREMEPIGPHVIPVIFVLDASASMQGDKLWELNEAVREIVVYVRYQLEERSRIWHEKDVMHVGVLRFGRGCEWLTGENLVPMDELTVEQMEVDQQKAGGMTDLGAALRELDAKLSRQGFFRTCADKYLPVIFFVTDGRIDGDWRRPLEAIRKNNEWYRCAIKGAIAVGNDADVGVLTELVQDRECLTNMRNSSQLGWMLVKATMGRDMDDMDIVSSVSSEDQPTLVACSAMDADEHGYEQENKATILPRPMLPVILVLDTSGSMSCERIEGLNRAIYELREQLCELSQSEDVDVRVGVLRFSTGCEWVTGEELVPVDELAMEQLEAGGMTDLGEAMKKLDAMLFRLGQEQRHLVRRPVIAFVTDGQPTDVWQYSLEEIRENEWYSRAVKYAIAVGDDVDAGILAEVVQGEENVFRAADGEQLRQLLVRQTMAGCGASMLADDLPAPDPDEIPRLADDADPEWPWDDVPESPWDGPWDDVPERPWGGQEESLQSDTPSTQVIFVLDTSENMRGEKIDRLNSLAAQAIEVLREGELAAKLRIAVLEVNTEARWAIEPQPLDESFQWTPLTAGGKRNLIPAAKELSSMLSTQNYTPDPFIVYMLGGRAEDDWVEAIFRLWDKQQYRDAEKIGVCLDEQAADTLAALAGTTAGVLQPKDLGELVLCAVRGGWSRPPLIVYDFSSED